MESRHNQARPSHVESQSPEVFATTPEGRQLRSYRDDIFTARSAIGERHLMWAWLNATVADMRDGGQARHEAAMQAARNLVNGGLLYSGVRAAILIEQDPDSPDKPSREVAQASVDELDSDAWRLAKVEELLIKRSDLRFGEQVMLPPADKNSGIPGQDQFVWTIDAIDATGAFVLTQPADEPDKPNLYTRYAVQDIADFNPSPYDN